MIKTPHQIALLKERQRDKQALSRVEPKIVIPEKLYPIIAYGTLRKGCTYREEDLPFIISLGTQNLEGFKMYREIFNKRSAKRFPFVMRSRNKKDKIKVELLLANADQMRQIRDRERDYIPLAINLPEYERPFIMWIQDLEWAEELPGLKYQEIPNNWVTYARKEKIL